MISGCHQASYRLSAFDGPHREAPRTCLKLRELADEGRPQVTPKYLGAELLFPDNPLAQPMRRQVRRVDVAWVVPLLVTAVLVAAMPTARACSYGASGGPPDPGRIYVQDLTTGRIVHQVDVWQRGLDGDCGIKKANDLDGDRLVWTDQVGEESGGVYFRHVQADYDPVLVWERDALYYDLDLHGDQLLAYYRIQAPDGERTYHVHRVDLKTGEQGELDLDVDWLGDPVVVGGLVVWDDVDRNTYDHRLNVYDTVDERWIFRDASFAELGAPADSHTVAASDRWLIIREGTEEGAIHAYDLADGTLHDLAGLDLGHRRSWTLDGDLLYGAIDSGELGRVHLPDTRTQARFDLQEPLFRESTVEDGRVVLGSFSVSDEEWGDGARTPPAWITQAEPMVPPPPPPDPPLLGAPGIVLLVSVLGLAAIIRRRRRP